MDGKGQKPQGPVYRVHTQRLVVRCWTPQDARLLQQAIEQSLDHLRPWMPWTEKEPEPWEAKIGLLRTFRGNFDLDKDYVYGIFDSNETKVLGGTGLHTRRGEGAREIGYWIHSDFLNQGLATEAAAALVKVAFEVDGVERVEIHCDPGNVSSAAIPRKLGFQHVATLPWSGDSRNERDEEMVWMLFADAYPDSPAAEAVIEAYDVMGNPVL
jgi:RimJ/RimL family protein N-acetyltransferase